MSERILMKVQDVVLIGGGDPPSGEISIVQNGRTNVAQYAYANVNVPQPSGKITITQNATGLNISQYAEADVAVPSTEPTGTINITENGDHNVSAFATAHVAVPTNEIPLRDRLIIPDKYNTGCKGDLVKFDYEEDTSGLIWTVADNYLQLNFNVPYGGCLVNLSNNDTIVFENYDFTDYEGIQITNAAACVNDSPNYRSGIKIIFKNCLFITLGANQEFSTADMIQFEVYNSSFANTSWSNTKYYNCLIGNKTFYRENYGESILGDGAQPKSYTSFTNCYFMDIEPEVDTSSQAHFDGLQTIASVQQPQSKDHHLYNCRFECMDMPYEPKGGQWSYAVFWEGNNPDSSMEYCQIHGGGYCATSIVKGDRQTVQNNFIEQSYNSPCVEDSSKYQMSDGFASYYTTLFVSSVWLEDGKICIVCTNDTNSSKTLRVVTDQNVTYTFSLDACPTFADLPESGIESWSEFPFDQVFRVDAAGVRSIKCYDGQTEIRSWIVDASAPLPAATLSITQNGEYSVLDYAKVDVDVPQPSGKITITQNATGLNISQYAEADVAVPQGITPSGSRTFSENGTYDVTQIAEAIIDVPQYGKPSVPQSGGWQYKTTPTKGYIILGKDDDPNDSAQFVRMISGYGFPMVLNSIWQEQSSSVLSDADTANSQYPSGSVSAFPNGGTINQLNKYVIQKNLGEIALHGGDNDKIWDSSLLTGATLDAMYNTYSTGGGTKTKEELRAAIMNTYADTDVEQGATRITYNRNQLQSLLDAWVYTIGMWGGGHDFVIDGITVGGTGSVESGSQKVSRVQNFMGDGILTDVTRPLSPYWIYRNSAGMLAANIGSMCTKAYNEKICVECFQHWYLNDSSERWADMKSAMDTLASYVSQGKVEVVTRKQYYELGEWVEHPIVSVSITPDALTYPTGTTLTESNLICKAILDNGTEVTCAADRIIDMSDVDTTTAGTYTVSLQYRGYSATGAVIISSETPTNYLLENGSFSGESMVRNVNYCEFDSPITFEANKNYRLQFNFTAETTAYYASHYIRMTIADTYSGWRTTTPVDINVTGAITSAAVTIDIATTAQRTLNEMILITALQNVDVGAWSVTDAYIYEYTPEE